jgi:hypothetical protein
VTDIIISGLTCQIGPDFYPCIHTCNVVLQNVNYSLNDFITMCNTVPKIIQKPGFFKVNWDEKINCLYSATIDVDNILYDLFHFQIYNINSNLNILALKNIYYNNKLLTNVLHT